MTSTPVEPASQADGASSSDPAPTGGRPGHALEWQAPTLIRIDEHTTIPSMLQDRVRRSAARPLIARKQEIGETWRNMTAQEFYDDVLSVAAGLIGMGLEPGDRVAIMSRTRYEWTLLDFACWTAALVPVPIYETSSAEQIAYVLADADARLVVAETITTAELVRAAAASLNQDGLKVLSLDTGALHTITEAGRDVSREQVRTRTDSLTTESIATIVYTSGTTGSPKGTVLSHGNFTNLCSNAHLWMPEIGMGRGSRLLLFLPLAHVFARFLEVFQISGEGIMGHAPDTKNLLSDLASFRPSYLLVVPRVLEKIYNSADAQAGGGGARRIFRWAAKVAIEYSRAQDTPAGPSRALRAQRAAADRLVYQRIRTLVGGNADWIISGGAPLSTRLAHFYRGLGIPVLEGYGLTETVGPIAVNTPRLSKIGTVGPPLPPMAVRISSEGEILLKGPSVFQGYHHDPEATAAAFTDDGWFRTGDLGSLDRDGYVTITGRAKDVIVTAGGKNVSPAALEDSLRGHPLISQVVVVGEQRPFVAALITLDAEMLPTWLRTHDLEPMTVAEAAVHPQVLAALNRAVDRANKHVSRAESIRKIRVLTDDFTEANGLLTPSLKVRRSAALKHFAADIDAIYGGPAGVQS
ncbi:MULTISPECIES: long-chain fatty acid--CoA ligase [unclassified Actinomyces]|uniref:AMP-dependent synthetase/ligase n=1 Tax=unclassified Actinomyces TaxID=2609248 RepID=UPI000D59DF8A|nr:MULTISPECIES: AMP-dependent synthetase/ligase [unclassified Actinomyces]RAX20372.1 long-chain fatty acid--CoA ligase [Actinomyces sp. Z5]RAX23554.1 long-chain fatty acid--CoA ligase [Actinomyces sp. Z3]